MEPCGCRSRARATLTVRAASSRSPTIRSTPFPRVLACCTWSASSMSSSISWPGPGSSPRRISTGSLTANTTDGRVGSPSSSRVWLQAMRAGTGSRCPDSSAAPGSNLWSPRSGPRRRRSSARCAPSCLPRVRERSEAGLDLGAEVFKRGRQREPLAQVLLRLVGRESRTDRGDLEQHPARLAEVDGPEVEAVDHRRRVAAALDDAAAPRLVVLHRRRPRDVVHRPRAAQASRRGGRVVDVERAARVASRLIAVRLRAGETERFAQELIARVALALECPYARKALQGEMLRDLGVPCHKRTVAGRLGDELKPQALRVVEAETVPLHRGFDPGVGEAPRPELERLLTAHPKRDAVDHACPGAAAHQARILEEGEVGARASVLVGVEEVVDGRVVLVDRLLDQAQSHHSRIEEDVFRRVGGDGADVVDAVQALHSPSSTRNPGRIVPKAVTEPSPGA